MRAKQYSRNLAGQKQQVFLNIPLPKQHILMFPLFPCCSFQLLVVQKMLGTSRYVGLCIPLSNDAVG